MGLGFRVVVVDHNQTAFICSIVMVQVVYGDRGKIAYSVLWILCLTAPYSRTGKKA